MICSIPYLLERAVQRYSDKVFITEQDRDLSFFQFSKEALSTAAVLRQMGVKKGDRVGVCMAKTIDQAVVIMGIMLADAVFVPILPKLKYENVDHIVNHSGMSAVVVDPVRLKEVEKAALGRDVRIVLGTDTGDQTDLARLPYMRNHVSEAVSEFSCIGMDSAAIIYSSGSTGRPNGVVVSHRNLFDGARIITAYLGTGFEDRIAGNLTFNFDYGLNQIWQCLYTGASLHLHEFIFPNDFFRFLVDENITVLPLMPVFISRMFDQRFSDADIDYDFSKVRYVCTTGGRVSGKMIDDLKATFQNADIYLMYGLTEAFRSSYLPPGQLDVRPNSIGRAIPDVELYVLDQDHNDCPPGVPGELVHRGGCVAKGYWNDGDRTAKRFRQIPRFPGETVVFSGDLVTQDSEGYIYFVGRSDEMMKTHGFRVSPTEVEDIANKFEGVSATVALGIENIEIGEDIVLLYTVDDGSTVEDTMYRQYLKRQLPSHMVPRYIFELDQFQSTGNEGKIDRQLAKEKALEILSSDPAQ